MPDNSENNKRIAKNSIVLTIQMVFVLALTLYTTRVVLNVLGVEDYGVYNVVCGFVSMFTFLNISMSNGIQRFFNFELGKNGLEGATKIFNHALIIQIILMIVIVMFAETLGLWYLNNKMVIPSDRIMAAHWIFQFSVLGFIFIILQAPFTAAVLAHEKMSYYASINLLDAILKIVIVLILPYLSGDRLVIYGLLYALINLLNFVLYFIYTKLNFKEIRIAKSFTKETLKSMLSFSGWNIFGAFSNMMKEQGINLVINLFFGPVVNAARGVAFQVNGGLQSFVTNLTVAMRPQMIQSYAQGNVERTMSLAFTISKLSCLVLFFISLPIILEIDFILDIWLNGAVPDHTATFVYIVIATSFVNNLNSAVSGVVHASGKMKLYQVTGGLCILLSIPAAYLALSMGLAPEWALIMSFVCMSLAQIVALIVLKTIVEYSILRYVKEVIIPFLLVIITSFWLPYICRISIDEGFIRFLVVTLVSFVSTGFITYFIGLNKTERNAFKKGINKVLHI